MNSGRRTARQEEELQVQRRNAELRKQEQWNQVADYFKTMDLKTSKYASWTSDSYFQQRKEARMQEEQKKKTLAERKVKLKKVLEEEENCYEKKFKSKKRRVAWIPLEDLKEFRQELKQLSDETDKKEAELMLYHKWKQEQPSLRDLERNKNLEFMKKTWLDQVKEKDAAKIKEKEEEALRAKDEELRLREEDELKKLQFLRKEEELKELKAQIKQQIEVIKETAQKCEELKIEEAKERERQAEIEELITQRKLAEQKQANKQLVAFWTRQYQIKLQKKAKEIENEIILDQQMLQRLENEFHQEVQARAHAKDIAKKEMELALKELHTQRQRELLRQQEFESLFYEEAKRIWERQEKKWAQERQARELLIGEVLTAIKKQIEEKIEKNCVKRAKALTVREESLTKIDQMYEEFNQRELEMKLVQENYYRDLKQQILDKYKEKDKKAIEESEIDKKIWDAEIENEKKLASEVEKMKSNDEAYRPKDFRRRRVVW